MIFQDVHTSTYSYFLTIAAVSIALQDGEVIEAKLIIHMHPVNVKLGCIKSQFRCSIIDHKVLGNLFLKCRKYVGVLRVSELGIPFGPWLCP